MLVVGKRGLGVIPRMLVGSTSLAVAGRSPVPVAVVPTGWVPEDHATEPVVLGVDPSRATHHLMHLAFRRAERLGVPLVAVHGWEAPSALWTDSPVDEWERRGARGVREDPRAVAPLRFGAVELRDPSPPRTTRRSRCSTRRRRARSWCCIGRHASSRFTGFVFGSVTRAVLHYATVPVLVVPTDEG